jgi:hypothetical protein
MDFGSGLTANASPVLTPLPLPISKGYQEPEKGESYESSVVDRHPVRVGDPGHDIE